ncbi:hypothetical protein Y032_0890g2885 [Ancylostoma ceylanicum]|uniref:Galactosyltransferase N-terminal domain-containing protein n=4 Tax=Ancylostoma ceylanicum TaxID=53326 RepID=A0A016W9J7_9BILA|nr:hypothetical protein Y032_0890g2885 [Ancylostoma ceylanicum]
MSFAAIMLILVMKHDRNTTLWDSKRAGPTHCSLKLNEFSGPIRLSMEELPFEYMENKYSYLMPGGHYTPSNCIATDKLAVIIPFRDRDTHLRILLNNMHRFLTKQMLDYSIIVVEQVANQTLNRAKLFNVGFVEAMLMYPWSCILFHDVDVLPEDDRILHTCPTRNPRHMAVAMNKFDYKYAKHLNDIDLMDRL